ncbi:zinc-ribbon domain-containing protein [Candidatus Sulfidibacterium hydrothermale]|nr:zinc-ribbon domain-containing protein [Candidatus Sulfidibacterium hydrothermale]
MIFIAGSHPKITQYRCTQQKYCFRCHNNSYWILEKQQQFLSLFFLPVLPLKTSYLCHCPICGNTEFLDRETFEKKVASEAEPL